ARAPLGLRLESQRELRSWTMAAKKSVQLSGIVVAESAISSIDPDEGVLMYRGYDIADLAEHSTYEETALLLLDGELPSSARLAAFEGELAERRSEEHTSELQSQSNLVCRLLLEKKKRETRSSGSAEPPPASSSSPKHLTLPLIYSQTGTHPNF